MTLYAICDKRSVKEGDVEVNSNAIRIG